MAAFLALLPALLSPLPLLATQEEESCLDLAPSDAVFAVHLDSVSELRTQLVRNNYYQFLTSPEGVLGVFGDEVPVELRTILALDPTEEQLAALDEESRAILGLLHAVSGSATLYVTHANPGEEPVVGVVLEPGDRMPQFAELVTELAQKSGEISILERGPLRVGVPTRSLTGQGDFHAGMIFSADRFGFTAGEDDEAVRAEFERLVDRMSGAEGSSLLANERFVEARGALTSPGQIDLFLDVATLMQWAALAPELPNDSNPQEILQTIGADRMRWMAGRANIGTGEVMDLEFQVHIPENSMVASMADLFGPLPLNLIERIPADAVAVSGLNFDLAGLFDLALDSVDQFAEGMGELGRAQIEQFGSMLGVDLEADLLDQFTGGFATYSIPAQELDFEEDPMAAMMLSSGFATAWVIELYDADLVADSIDGLIEFASGMMTGGLGIGLETMSVSGMDLLQPAGTPFAFGFQQNAGMGAMAAGLDPSMVAELLSDPSARSKSVLDHEKLGPLVQANRNASSFSAGLTAQMMVSTRTGLLGLFQTLGSDLDTEGEAFEAMLDHIDRDLIESFFQGVGVSSMERLTNSVKLHYRTR